MMPPHFPGQPHPHFPQIRHHTPSASPPIGNGGPFQPHPGVAMPRGHTPQPPIGSRPSSRTDMRRMGPGMISQTPPPAGPTHPGISYMPTPPIYNAAPHPSGLMQSSQQYAYARQQQQSQQQHLQQPYVDDRRSGSMPPTYTAQPHAPEIQAPPRPTPSPQPNHQQLPPNPVPQISPPQQPQQLERRLQDPLPPPPIERRPDFRDRPQPPLLNTETAIKKLPQRKSHSIFTPIEENRSILSQHLASFANESSKNESAAAAAAANAASAARAQSIDVGALNRAGTTKSPPVPQRSITQTDDKIRAVSLSSIPETTLTPPSRSSSVKVGGAAGGARPRGPRLKVQIPDGGSDAGGSATAGSDSPHNTAEAGTTQAPQRHNSQSSLVLPPPSPSASAILSAGATGPPNPFARPPPQQNVNGDTPVSALPSRFLTSEFLPSPSSFYPDWNFRGSDNNTLPSPLNFATPVVGSGPSFLRDDNNPSASSNPNSKDAPAINGGSSSNLAVQDSSSTATKRKTPEPSATQNESAGASGDPKRVKTG